MLDDIQIGPFTYCGGKILLINGQPARRWRMEYRGQEIAEKVRTSSSEQDAFGVTSYEISTFFDDERAGFVRVAKLENAPGRVDLVEFDSGNSVAQLDSESMCGMTAGLIDDRSRFWLRSADRRYSRAVTLSEYAQIAVQYAAPAHCWIAALLPAEVLTDDSEKWRAPSSWELRHVVGEGSFTGVTGAKAAELVGVLPQNFRKYTAKDGASSRQAMSFAMWHLLIHKLGVKRA